MSIKATRETVLDPVWNEGIERIPWTKPPQEDSECSSSQPLIEQNVHKAPLATWRLVDVLCM